MKYWYLGALTVAALALGNACSSNNIPPGPSPSLQDEYEPLGPVDPNGGITQITFTNGFYTLKRMVGGDPDEVLVSETGTYALDVNGGNISLTPQGGSPQKHSFQVGLIGNSSTVSTNPGGLQTLGLGQTIINFILSFFLDGKQFHTDAPATVVTNNNGAGDDAGWPPVAVDDGGGEGGGEGGCAIITADAGPTTSSGNGIDVSHYQGSVDWTNVHSTRNFAYAKATEGVKYTDSTFAANYAAMQAAGMQRGAYHFFRASKDAVAQADKFVAVLQANGFSGSDLAPMIDVEVLDGVDAATATAGVRSFVNEAQSKLGVTLIVYTGPSFWTHQMGNPDFSGNPLWIAHYTQAAKPSIPSTWSSYMIWQYSQSDNVAGVSGGVDGDRWNGAAIVSSSDGGSTAPLCGADAGDAASGDASDGGLIPGTCTHDVCTSGVALGQACTSCTMVVCANDPYCCDTYWGLSCFPDVQKYCGVTCP